MVYSNRKAKFLFIFFYLDIIFFIYLYQRYIYPVDRTRLNEFGTSGETDSAVVPVPEQTQVAEATTTTEEHEKTD